jgi:DNA polymerase (family 10)
MLLQLDDIRGDLHVHTDWSDGRADIAEMAQAARARGYEYVVISDHSPALKVFGGLTEKRFLEQMAAIREVNGRLKGITVLSGAEVDIRSDGSLDLPDALLARLDLVTASVHSAFKQRRETMTQRLISAIRNPHVDVIGHPTGRLIGSREPYDLDLDAVIREAGAHGKILEINAQPERLDLGDQACRRAKELGVRLAISTDAHSTDQLEYMRFGVAVARRGWLEGTDVLNAQPLRELKQWLKGKAR